MSTTELVQLRHPIPYQDLEWRVLRAGQSQKGIWALLAPYVTARGVMERLDDVLGPDRWQTSKPEQWTGGAIIGIGIRVEDGWIWKWDGSEEPSEQGDDGPKMALKGSLSCALKRAAVAWGIGRELYAVGDVWAKVSESGTERSKFKVKGSNQWVDYRWSPPSAQEWAQILSKAGVALTSHTTNPSNDALLKITQRLNKLRPHLLPEEEQGIDDALFAGADVKTLTGMYNDLHAKAKGRRENALAGGTDPQGDESHGSDRHPTGGDAWEEAS